MNCGLWLLVSSGSATVAVGTVLELPESWMTLGHDKRSSPETPLKVPRLKLHKLLKLLWSPLPSKPAMPGCEGFKTCQSIAADPNCGSRQEKQSTSCRVRAWNISYSAILLSGDANRSYASHMHKDNGKGWGIDRSISKNTDLLLGQFPKGEL